MASSSVQFTPIPEDQIDLVDKGSSESASGPSINYYCARQIPLHVVILCQLVTVVAVYLVSSQHAEVKSETPAFNVTVAANDFKEPQPSHPPADDGNHNQSEETQSGQQQQQACAPAQLTNVPEFKPMSVYQQFFSPPTGPIAVNITNFVATTTKIGQGAHVELDLILYQGFKLNTFFYFGLVRKDKKVFTNPSWTRSFTTNSFHLSVDLVRDGEYELVMAREWTDWPKIEGCVKSNNYDNELSPAPVIIVSSSACPNVQHVDPLPVCNSLTDMTNGHWESIEDEPIVGIEGHLLSINRRWVPNSCTVWNVASNEELLTKLDGLWLLMIGDSTTEELAQLFLERHGFEFSPANNRPDFPPLITDRSCGPHTLNRYFDTVDQFLNGRIRVQFMWSGHEQVCNNFHGLLTFDSQEWRDKLDKLFLPPVNTPTLPTRPTAIVFNSGLHDFNKNTSPEWYEVKLEEAVAYLLTKTDHIILRVTNPKHQGLTVSSSQFSLSLSLSLSLSIASFFCPINTSFSISHTQHQHIFFCC
jgi:hypothetical protein